MSRDGLIIDLESVEAILVLPLLAHKKGPQIFFRIINFVRRFIPNHTAMVKSLITILRKNMNFTWTKEGKASFEEIKKTISSFPLLLILGVTKISSFTPLEETQVYQLF